MPTSSPHIDENSLVDLLKDQDKTAIQVIYRQYKQALFGVIMRILNDEEAAEDVFQECLVKFWRKGSTYDPSKGRLFTWMLNICRNAAIDKTRSKEFKYRSKTQPEDSVVDNTLTETRYEMRTDQIGIKEMVMQLDPKYRELVELVYFGGRSQREAAKELQMPLGTVKTRLRTALGMMRKWIKA